MKKQLVLTITLLSLVYVVSGQTFSDHNIISTGSLRNHVSSFAISDITNDGKLDIISCSGGSIIYTIENMGDMEFERIQKVKISWNKNDLYEVKTGDIDNDGFVDLLYSRYDYSSQLSWMRNLGDNTFGAGGIIYHVPSPGSRTVTFDVHDLNGDGVDDVIVCSINPEHNDLVFRLNQGDGQFYPNYETLIDTGKVVDFVCDDYDMDGDIDIIYSTKIPEQVIIAINNGSADFSEKHIIGSFEISDMMIFDSDIDGDNDIIGITKNDSLCVFENNENIFNSRTYSSLDTLVIKWNLAPIDFDNDGDIDLINRSLAIMENMGNNTFSFLEDYNFPLGIWEYCIDDIDKNGDEEIIFGTTGGAIGCIKDASSENIDNWRIVTGQVMRPKYPAFEKINNDEFPDICLHDYYYKYVFYLNNGKGEFLDTLNLGTLNHYSDESEFFDINHDGYSDIISYSDEEWSGFSDSSHFQIARNNGDNTFSRFYFDDFNHFKYKHTDFIDYNNDGFLNAVTISRWDYPNNDTIWFFKINPDFSIGIYDTIIANLNFEIRNFKFHDIDGNGENDMIINDEQALYINYSINNRFGNTFYPIINSEDNIYDFVVTDINNDSIEDLIFATHYHIGILENFEGTSYNEPYYLETENGTRILLAEDIDFDGIEELFSVSDEYISLFKNISSNSYSIEEYPYINNSYNYTNQAPFIFNDIDLDGDLDLLCTYSQESDVSWFENSYVDADYVHFPENNAVWTEHNSIIESFPTQTWTSLYTTESDTILHGTAYTNIYEYYLNPTNFDTIRQLYASFRQDTIQKKVFILRHYLDENTEKLLLDFSASKGDTIILGAYYWEIDPLNTDSLFIVDSIATVFVFNGEERDVMYLSSLRSTYPMKLTLMEGIGSTDNPFGPPTRLVNKDQQHISELCCPNLLLCLSINEEPVYVLNEESECMQLEVWSSIENNEGSKAIELFPNPATGSLTIELQELIVTNATARIYNNYGEKLEHILINSNQSTFTIDIEGFKSGIYYLIVDIENKKYSNKFIVID